jgi:hypothetical protein
MTNAMTGALAAVMIKISRGLRGEWSPGDL